MCSQLSDSINTELVSESAEENDTVQNIEMLFKAAQDNDFLVFISPHYYYPHDMGWLFEGKGEAVMHSLGTFVRTDQLSEEGFEGSGADWLEQYKPYIAEDNVIVSSPHKVYGPEQNDLILQMRKKKIDRVILGGMSANLCVESHMRELIEQGFEVHVVKDATAGAKDPDLGDGYAAALTNFKYIANGVLTTDEAISAMGADANEIAVAIDRREGEEVEIETESNGAARL